MNNLSRARELLDQISEMANLPEKETGIKGFIYISTKQGNHGPRIKYYKKLGQDKPSLSIQISKDPKVVVVSSGFVISSEIEKKLIQYIKLNRIKLLKFWKHGTKMTRGEVNKLLDSLIPVK